jgi:lipopolysaccharide biosynthesis glycosyltransferase
MVIDGGIAPWTKRRIVRSLDANRVEIRWLRPDVRRLRGLKISGHIRVASYFRLLVPDLLPESCARAIYLDSDVVVEGDLAKLWAVDLGGRPLAAAQDMTVPLVSSRYGLRNYEALGLAPDAKYFNAGVMLMDLALWREERISDAVLAYVTANPAAIRFWDQDGLNALLARRWLELDPRWNVTFQAGLPLLEQHRGALAAPFVTHFVSTREPWHVDCDHPRRQAFFTSLDRTRWAGWRPSDALGRRVRSRIEAVAGRIAGDLALRGWSF